MPKKHQPAYASIRPTHSTSSGTSGTSRANPAAPQQSVNDRLQQLRREQAPRTTVQRRDEITEPGFRYARNVGANGPGQRRPPGPAAPSSWLRASQYAPKSLRRLEREGALTRRQGFGKLARCFNDEHGRFHPPKSLIHQCLRTFASHWQDLVEYEQHYLSSLPISLRETLLSYLALYGERGDLDSRTFRILFQNDVETEGSTSAWQDVRFLDLTGLLLDSSYSLKDLERSLPYSTGMGGSLATVVSSTADLSLDSDSPRRKGKQKLIPQVAESWEDEADDPPVAAPAIVLPHNTLPTPVFPHLTHLSLAHPGSASSWVDLLSISPHLKTLTHLSLAYWPRPSTTPNAGTTSMVSPHGGSVSLGGSHFYSDLDDDWHEAANILRRLSKNTYCLQWLDLEGCTWLPALTWDPHQGSQQSLPTHGTARANDPALTPTGPEQDSSSEEDWPGSPLAASSGSKRYTPTGPDWTSSWRQITHLNLSQSWIPADPVSLQTLPSGVVCVQLMNWLREQETLATSPPFLSASNPSSKTKSNRLSRTGDTAITEAEKDEEWMRRRERWEAIVQKGTGRSHREVAEWVEREKVARGVGAKVQAIRRVCGGLWCTIEHGWG
ncbi:unnamed protein product [Periconia digitata]|uniref:Tafazzin n=1 Tax=Periconia digitata TaxID=1303443 RepID=A0A9W4XLX2_9PLEO|nr:unnamed protein product [Periconia digitata]